MERLRAGLRGSSPMHHVPGTNPNDPMAGEGNQSLYSVSDLLEMRGLMGLAGGSRGGGGDPMAGEGNRSLGSDWVRGDMSVSSDDVRGGASAGVHRMGAGSRGGEQAQGVGGVAGNGGAIIPAKDAAKVSGVTSEEFADTVQHIRARLAEQGTR